MSWLALCPSDTIVVTAAMPMTTPRIVKPERSLFLASVRNEITNRSSKSMKLPRCGTDLGPDDNLVALCEVADQDFRELVLDQSQSNGNGAQQPFVLDPDNPLMSL